MAGVNTKKILGMLIAFAAVFILLFAIAFNNPFREILGLPANDLADAQSATVDGFNAKGLSQSAGLKNIGDTTARLHWVECWFDIPEDREIDCGRWYFTPESSQDSLPVVILRDRSVDHQDDPVFYLSGGPGNSTYLEADNVETWFYWSQIANLSRDLILVDQRGTGLSTPKVKCPDYVNGVRDVLGKNLSVEEEFKQLDQAINECIEKVSRQGIDISQFSTNQSAQDMDGIANALGYESWNIVGGSYGTRLGLAWLKLQPAKIKSAVLDSVYPPGEGSLIDWPATFANSFSRLWNLCATHEWCTQTPEELKQEFLTAVETLNKQPQTISVSLWQGDWPIETVVNGHRFVSSLYQALYDDTLHDDIVSAMGEIARGEVATLTKLAENSINSELAPEFNPLVYFAVECAESRRVTEQAYAKASAQFPEWEEYTRYAWTYDVCRQLKSRTDLDAFENLSGIEQPVLILSGGLDPVTPSEWAFELTTTLPFAQHWHFSNIGHGIINSSACVHESIRSFIDNPQQKIANPCENP